MNKEIRQSNNAKVENSRTFTQLKMIRYLNNFQVCVCGGEPMHRRNDSSTDLSVTSMVKLVWVYH